MWQSIGRWVLAEETAQVIAGYWDKVGVKTKVQVLEWAEFNKRSAASAHKDCFYYAFINGTWDASYTVQRFKPDFQTFRYFDASGDLLKTIEEYERTFDPKKRKELGAKALKGLHDEAVWLFLWQLDELFGVSRKVKGFKMRPDNVLWVRDTYVEA
jgi:peptide/nickel transport system substrate-binding protein